MHDPKTILTDGADVTFICGQLEGITTLLIRSTGPLWAAKAMSADFKDLRYREAALYDNGENILRFVVFDGASGLLTEPLLTGEINTQISEAFKNANKGRQWLLGMEFIFDGKKGTSIWLTDKPEGVTDRTRQLIEGDKNYVDRWLSA